MTVLEHLKQLPANSTWLIGAMLPQSLHVVEVTSATCSGVSMQMERWRIEYTLDWLKEVYGKTNHGIVDIPEESCHAVLNARHGALTLEESDMRDALNDLYNLSSDVLKVAA